MNIQLVYYLLMARYANSVIASSDENRFKYQVFSTIFQYGPTWAKKLDYQKKIRNLSDEEITLGSTNIINNAANPNTVPSDQTLEELPYINNQNVSKVKRSKPDAYAIVLSLLEEDVSEEFINRFKKLFLTVVAPEQALWYITYGEGETDQGNIYDGVTMTKNFRNRYFAQVFPSLEEFEAEWNSTPFAQYLLED